MIKIERLRILGIPVDVVDMALALAYVREVVEGEPGPARAVLAINPEKVVRLQAEPPLKAFFEQAGLLIPDGVGVVLAAFLLFGRIMTRVTGVDLMHRICALRTGTGSTFTAPVRTSAGTRQ